MEVVRMTYQDAVAQAANALKQGEDANWELARLTFENTKGLGNPGTTPGVTMEQWAEDVRSASGRRFSARTAGLYKTMWSRFGLQALADRPTWTDALYEVQPESSWHDRTARLAHQHIDTTDVEGKRDLAVKLMADPEVADAVISAPEPRRAVYEALNRREQAADVRRERLTDADPVSSGLRSMNALVEMDTVLGRFVQDFANTFRQMASLPEHDPFANREFLTLRLNHAQECLDQLRSYLDTGKTDIDTFLDSVLKG